MEELFLILSCKNIKKSYGINLILNDINFQIDEGQHIALVGGNGTGKSTLFKIIAGEISSDHGHCILPKNTTLGYLSQNLDLNNENTLWEEMLDIFMYLIEMEKQLRQLEQDISIQSKTHNENLNLLMEEYGHLQEKFETENGYGYPSQIRGILTGLEFKEVDYQKQIKKFSGGQKTRIALAKLLLKQPDLLLLDEPTNFLDLETTEWLEAYLSNYPNALFIISHDRYFLDTLVDQVFELENNKLSIYKGNYSKYARYKKENLEVSLHQYEQQQNEIKRQEEVIMKLRSFNREKSIKRAESRQKSLDKIEQLERPTSQLPTVHLNIQPQIESGRDVLRVQELSKSFGEHPVFSNINFEVFKGEHIGIIGPNGIGKSTLFNIILNHLPSDTGEIYLGRNVFPAYYEQLQSDLDTENTILEEVWSAKPSATQTEIRNVLGAFLFSGEDVFKEIHSLSGGEKSRVSLAKLMLSRANLLLMDEPTNHLDIATKEVLENALKQYEGTLLAISHDRYFLNKVTNKIFKMNANGIEQFLGNYDYYLEKKKQQQLLKEAQEAKPIINKTLLKQERKKEKANRFMLKEQQQKVKSLELKIENLENKISNFENKMCEPGFYNSENATNITKEYNDTKQILIKAMTKWEKNMLLMEKMQT